MIAIDAATRARIADLQGSASSRETAELYGVSDRTVRRIWAEARTTGPNDGVPAYARDKREGGQCGQSDEYPPEDPGELRLWMARTVGREWSELLEHERRQVAYYEAMEALHPTNCAWGHLAHKHQRLRFGILRDMGAACGLGKVIFLGEDGQPRTAEELRAELNEERIKALKSGELEKLDIIGIYAVFTEMHRDNPAMLRRIGEIVQEWAEGRGS